MFNWIKSLFCRHYYITLEKRFIVVSDDSGSWDGNNNILFQDFQDFEVEEECVLCAKRRKRFKSEPI